jgi:hypothetical protein
VKGVLAGATALFALAAWTFGAGASGPATLYPCAGAPAGSPQEQYPEKRIYLENQAWVSPAPGTRKTAHIHVGACVPLYQDVTSATLHLDIKWQLHDQDGPNALVPQNFFVNLEGVYSLGNFTELPDRTNPLWTSRQCQAEQCEGWISYDFDISQVRSGWFNLNPFIEGFWPNAFMQGCVFDCLLMRTLTHWPIHIVNSNPQITNAENANVLAPFDYTGGASFFASETGSYGRVVVSPGFARTFVAHDQVSKLWDTASGNLIAQQDAFVINVGFEKPGARVMVDPAFHAVPPSAGTVVLDVPPSFMTGTHYYDVAVDTTKLSNGLHRLVMQDKFKRRTFEQSGLLVIPFYVDNPPLPPPTTTTATSPTTTPMPAIDIGPDSISPTAGGGTLTGDASNLWKTDAKVVQNTSSVSGIFAGFLADYSPTGWNKLSLHLVENSSASTTCNVYAQKRGSIRKQIARFALTPAGMDKIIPLPDGTNRVTQACRETTTATVTVNVDRATIVPT